MSEWYLKELRKMERQRADLNDKYSTLEKITNVNDMEHLINSSLKYAPRHGQTWQSYATELATHIKYADEKNTKTHVEGKTQWYTHRSPLGCFMCEDMAMRHVMHRVIIDMANKYPKEVYLQ